MARCRLDDAEFLQPRGVQRHRVGPSTGDGGLRDCSEITAGLQARTGVVDQLRGGSSHSAAAAKRGGGLTGEGWGARAACEMASNQPLRHSSSLTAVGKCATERP